MLHLIYVETTMDVNGNSRAGWIVVQGTMVRFIQERGFGRGALDEFFPRRNPEKPEQHLFVAELKVTPATYKRLCRGEFELR